jgi:hypothetical protein
VATSAPIEVPGGGSAHGEQRTLFLGRWIQRMGMSISLSWREFFLTLVPILIMDLQIQRPLQIA